MPDVIYRSALPSDRDAILDFANYVFSISKQPHDFRSLLPKVYGVQASDQAARHYLAERNGKILALVGVRPLNLYHGSHCLCGGFVGSVSVHPYARHEGHMRRVMQLMLDHESGLDFLALGGQRQRYGYWGFTQAGVSADYLVTPSNIRHALRNMELPDLKLIPWDSSIAPEAACQMLALQESTLCYVKRTAGEFPYVLRSWNSQPYLIAYNGNYVGYLAETADHRITEIQLVPECPDSYLPSVIRQLASEYPVTFSFAPWDKRNIRLVSSLAEGQHLDTRNMLRIQNWQKVLNFMFALQSALRPVAESTYSFSPSGLAVTYANRHISILSSESGESPDPASLQDQFFSPSHLLVPSGMPEGWTPLPFFLYDSDTF